jgi:hypothetical protein
MNNFGATAFWLKPTASDKGIYGFMSQLTMTGPFVNKTLFDQAKVPMPGPISYMGRLDQGGQSESPRPLKLRLA